MKGPGYDFVGPVLRCVDPDSALHGRSRTRLRLVGGRRHIFCGRGGQTRQLPFQENPVVRNPRHRTAMPYPTRRNRPLNSGLPSWQDLLGSASTPGQIVALANEYLGRLEPSDMVMLPEGCKIRFLHTADDVNGYAFD